MNETPLDELTKETDKITLLIISLSLISLFFALLGAGILTNGIVKPLIKLASTMKTIRQGNFEVSCKIDSEDEVGLLASVFNEMVRRLNELVADIKFEQKKKREL
ncbi:sensor histidine kinase, partial [Lysinibacillus sp. GbtcB16]|uniref:sensor histidine kinase n=1 Tax=Lysinibacillus sp. GbtcB16 TaxID=2824761 RepID=UPI001C2F1E9F